MDKCPKCGGTSGWYTKGEVWNYYKSNGEPDGYEFVSEGTMAICLDCGKRIKLTAIVNDAQKGSSSDRRKPVVKGGLHWCPRCKDNKILLCLYCDNCGQAIDWEDSNGCI